MELEFITVEEAATVLRVSKDTIRLWAKQRKFPTYKFGGKIMVERQDLVRYLASHRREEVPAGVADD
jgi:excisionase family DNA binding protein